MGKRNAFLALVALGIFIALPARIAPGSQAIETAPSVEAQASSPVAGSVNPDAATVVKSQAWDKIDFNSRRLTNNVWGAPAGETLASSIYLNTGKGFGWSWHRSDPKPRPGGTLTKPIYPSVRIGGSPWDPSSTPHFPVKVSDLKSLKLEVAYDYPMAPTGNFNLAYDLFLSDTNQPRSSPKPKAEVMIWLHHTFPEPADTYRGDFSDGARTYELYSWVMSDGRLYYAFVMKDQSQLQGQYTVDAKKLIDNLKLDPAWYIHGVELGNEVVNGSGKIEISKFSVNVNTSDL